MQRWAISESWGPADERRTVVLRIYFSALVRRGRKYPSCFQPTSQLATILAILSLSLPRSSSSGLPLMERMTPEKRTCSAQKPAFRSPSLQFPKRRSPRRSLLLKFPSHKRQSLLLHLMCPPPKLQSLRRLFPRLPPKLRLLRRLLPRLPHRFRRLKLRSLRRRRVSPRRSRRIRQPQLL